MATLSNKQVPDGTTLMNVIQQASTSIGTASISVVLFTALANKPDAMKAILYNRLKPAAPEPPHEWFQQAAAAFTTPFTVAAILVAPDPHPGLLPAPQEDHLPTGRRGNGSDTAHRPALTRLESGRTETVENR